MLLRSIAFLEKIHNLLKSMIAIFSVDEKYFEEYLFPFNIILQRPLKHLLFEFI